MQALLVALYFSHRNTNWRAKMTINAITIKLFGTKNTMFRVLNAGGEVLQVCNSKEEAEAWIAAQK